jgi:succinoglycan biosynthesis transport protein ExoP
MYTTEGNVELRTYLQILGRRWWIVLATFLSVFVSTIILTLNQTPIYRATASFIIAPEKYSFEDASRFVNGLDILSRQSEIPATYVEVAESDLVRQEASTALGLSPNQTKNLSVESEVKAGTNMVEIAVEGTSPTLARSFANRVGEITMVYMQELYEAYEFQPLDAASPPESPVKPNVILNLALAAAFGLALGAGLAFLAEYLDTRLHTVEAIHEVTALSVLGRIPNAGRWQRNILLDGRLPQREAYRRLSINVEALAEEAPLQTLVVTSAAPREGKSTIVANLALAMAQPGRRLIAVDADMRRPTLHSIYQLPNRIGMSSILSQRATLEEAVQDGRTPGLWVLTTGPVPDNVDELLSSPQMVALIQELEQRFDTVLIDTPALLAVADAAVLAPMADGVLLVVGRAQVGKGEVRTTCRELANAGARSVGVVVNRVRQDHSHRYHKYYTMSQIDQHNDPLSEISGIGPAYERVLNALGVLTFAQLAKQDPEDLAGKMGAHISAKRISGDRWVEQAQRFIQQKNQD